MLNAISFGTGFLIGAVIIGLLLTIRLRSESRSHYMKNAKLDEEKRSNNEKSERLEKIERDLEKKSDDLIHKISRISSLEEQLKQEKIRSDEKLTLLVQAKDTLASQFKLLANEIFEEKGKLFTEKNKESLETVLSPLKENINGFKKKVEETYVAETKERVVLKEELNRLAQLNQRLGDEAESLTNALAGQSQTQGAWGEMILETLLEQSGLVKGVHYQTQRSGEGSEGQRLRPDVVIRLPEGKDVIIDSKVSLTAYRLYCDTANKEDSDKHKSAHVRSVRTHVKDLANKNYCGLTDINALEYVLMFLPIEGAFSLAVEENHDLVTFALGEGVVIVTPTTLLLALRTIENIWRYEAQSQNAKEIATKAGQLYDKFVGFLTNIQEIGTQIDKAKSAQESALNKLSEGRGNLIKRATELKKLGAKTNKSLPKPLIEESDVTTEPKEFL